MPSGAGRSRLRHAGKRVLIGMVDGAIEIVSSSTATTVKRVHFAKIVRIVVSSGGGGCSWKMPRMCSACGNCRFTDQGKWDRFVGMRPKQVERQRRDPRTSRTQGTIAPESENEKAPHLCEAFTFLGGV